MDCSCEVVRNLPSDDDHLTLHRHGLDSRRELLVGLVGEGGEDLHLVCLGHSRADSILRSHGDRELNATGHLALGGVDGSRDLGLVYRVCLEDGVTDGEGALRSGCGSREERSLARSHARHARDVACCKHD